MHKTLLMALDSRDGVVKMGFDASNAHNEFDRSFAAQCVKDSIPALLPWLRNSLSVVATHKHVSADSTRMELKKTRGGDQGDALTGLIFPLSYKHVSDSVSAVSLGSTGRLKFAQTRMTWREFARRVQSRRLTLHVVLCVLLRASVPTWIKPG